MLVIIKISLLFFVLAFVMVGVAGITLCLQLTQKLNSTVRDILYIGAGVITLVTLCMNLSYMGVPYVVLYFIGFIFIGFCSIPIRILTRDY